MPAALQDNPLGALGVQKLLKAVHEGELRCCLAEHDGLLYECAHESRVGHAACTVQIMLCKLS